MKSISIIVVIVLGVVIGYHYLNWNLKKIDDDFRKKHYGEDITPEMMKDLDNDKYSMTIRVMLIVGGIVLFEIISICMGALSWE